MSPSYKSIPIYVVLNLFLHYGSLLSLNLFKAIPIKPSWLFVFNSLKIKIRLLIHVFEQRSLVFLRHFYNGDIKTTGRHAIVASWD